MNTVKNIIIFIVIATLLFFIFSPYLNLEKLPLGLNDTIKTWKDKDSLQHAKIPIIETEKTEHFLDIKSKDKKIQELQELVKKYKSEIKNQGSITNIETETRFDTIFPSTADSINDKKCTILDYINNSWIISTFGFHNGSTIFSLKVKNTYSIILGEENNGLFKPKVPYAEVINNNPYSETTSLRTYKVSLPKQKHFSFGPYIGYGISTVGPQMSVGIGVQYAIIKF
ncbi:MAG: hypothetical protein ACRC0V_08475 [Fusobacteriaceae bacterium]